MNQLQDSADSYLVRKIFGIFIVFFLLQLLLGTFLIYQVAIKQTTEYLQHITKRVREDIVYSNGKWDTHRYNADPNVPDTYPLYILSADGYVVDRWKPLHGFLDTSDVKHLLLYQTAQTITTPTNQTWRILSQPIVQDHETIGVITVSSFNPASDNLASIDQKLQDDIDGIKAKITIKNNSIDTTNLDARDIRFDISFQVVDKFNQIVTKNNNTNSIDRIPNYIDSSYIGSVVTAPSVRQIKDTTSNESFLIVTTPIVDKNNFVVGVIVIGRSIEYISEILHNFVVAELCAGIGLILIFSLFSLRIISSYCKKLLYIKAHPEKKEIDHISFDKKTGSLILGDEEIVIPYATNQYYLCEALFSNPKKRWEVDELLEKFGEQDLTNWRKIYDAMLIINKKVSHILNEKLVLAKEKTYFINPEILHKLAS